MARKPSPRTKRAIFQYNIHLYTARISLDVVTCRLSGWCMNLYDDNPHVQVFLSSYITGVLGRWRVWQVSQSGSVPLTMTSLTSHKQDRGLRDPGKDPPAILGSAFSPRSSMSCSAENLSALIVLRASPRRS